jgi:hypothetical protein
MCTTSYGRSVVTGPVTVYKRMRQADAYLYTGRNAADIVAWAQGHAYIAEGELYIITDRGDAVADPGDHIIHGLTGEWYPITPAAYEAGWREGPP